MTRCPWYEREIKYHDEEWGVPVHDDRKRFAPYLDKLGGEQELEELFLEFLRERVS